MRKMMMTSSRMMVTRQPIRTGVFTSSEDTVDDVVAAGRGRGRGQTGPDVMMVAEALLPHLVLVWLSW